MLQAISWGEYIQGMALLAGVWYAGVGLVCYRKEISAWLQSKARPEKKSPVPQAQVQQAEAPRFDALQRLVHVIDGILEESGTQADKAGLLQQLNGKLAGFDGLHHPAYRVAVINHIISKAEEICAVKITAQELELQEM